MDSRFHSRLLSQPVILRLEYYPRAMQAVLYARSTIPAPVRLEDVAMLAGMTPCSFSRYFAEKIGVPFSTALKVLRIERALQELEHRDCAIDLLASGCGYQSTCTFTRAFKRVVGTTPSEYRRLYLSNGGEAIEQLLHTFGENW